MSYHFFIAFAVLFANGTIFPVLGQSTVHGYDNEVSSISIVAEIQQLTLILEAFGQQIQVLQKPQGAFSQEMLSQHDTFTTSLQALDRRLNDHDIHIKNLTDISMRSLQAVDRRLQDHDIYVKNQNDIIKRNFQALDRRLDEHDFYVKNQIQSSRKLVNDVCGPESLVWDCSDIRASGQTASGVYEVCVRHQLDRFCTEAFCDMGTPNGPSLVFQRRKDGSVDFFRTWNEYKEGFGDRNGEFWLGNEMLNLLTLKRNYKLRIDLEDFEGNKRYAEYSRFSISSSAYSYKIAVRGYSGNAGDSLKGHNGQQFSTKDVDNDSDKGNCALSFRSAWWFNSCYWSNLNGIYHRGNYSGIAVKAEGIAWNGWHGTWYSLKSTTMKLIPVA